MATYPRSNFCYPELEKRLFYQTRNLMDTKVFLTESPLSQYWDKSHTEGPFPGFNPAMVSSWSKLGEPSNNEFLQLMKDFFESEKVDDILKIEGKNATNFELRLVWKSLMIQLNVIVHHDGAANFLFSVPNKLGADRLIFRKEMCDVFDKLINHLNAKRVQAPTQNLVNFKRDHKKNRIYATYNYVHPGGTLYSDEKRKVEAIKKCCYLIFSNSLLRLKTHKHLFHYLIKYPNLSLERIVDRHKIQLNISEGTDFSERWNLQKEDSKKTEEEKKNEYFNKQKCAIPIRPEGKSFSIKMAFTGIHEDRSEKDQKTIIGRGGFGIVTGAEFYGENAVMKKFIKQTRSGQSSATANTRRTTARPSEWRQLLKEDHIREFKANIEINCPLTPKFHGLAFCKNQSKEPILITDYVEGKKLSQCYKDIIEDDPEILPRIFLDIASALAHIHNKGFFHGDLSPNNVIVDYDSEVEEVKVNIIDFGLSDTIVHGRIWGHTIDYCAYESLRKDKPKKNLDKVDIFSFGGIMFNVFFRTSFTNYLVKRFLPSEFRKEKFSNRVKNWFRDKKHMAKMQSHIDKCFEELPQNNCIPNGLLEIMKRCVAHKVEDRPNSFELLTSLQEIFKDDPYCS